MSGDLIPVTTATARRRHYAEADAMQLDRRAGRYGRALCDAQTQTVVYDQESFDADCRYWGSPLRVIADLPPCKRCAKAAVRLEAVAE